MGTAPHHMSYCENFKDSFNYPLVACYPYTQVSYNAYAAYTVRLDALHDCTFPRVW